MAASSSIDDKDHRYRPIHDHPNLCGFLLNKVGSRSVSLRVAASTIEGAGSGLFVDEDVPEGKELFRSHPLLTVRNPDVEDVCDVCFQNTWSNCHPDGRFYQEKEKRPVIARCNGCKVACYCSKVCSNTYSRKLTMAFADVSRPARRRVGGCTTSWSVPS